MDAKDLHIRVAIVDALLLSFGLHLEIQEGNCTTDDAMGA